MRNRKNDIERYLRGELSPSEMHALEKEAMSDPFLAEALEGVEQAGADNFLFDLHHISRSVHDRSRKGIRKHGRSIGMWGWTTAIAATVLLVIVSGFLVINLLRQQSQQQASGPGTDSPPAAEKKADSLTVDKDSGPIALQKEESPRAVPPPRSRPAPAPEATREPANAGASDEVAEVREPAETASRAEASEPAQVAEAETSEEAAAPLEPVTLADVTQAESPLETVTEKRLQEKKLSRPLEGRVAGVQTESAPARVKRGVFVEKVKGNVISAGDGAPLPGVNVIIKNSNIGTVTDANGNYELPLPDAEATLVFDFIGFEAKEVSARDAARVALSEDTQTLSEVVVTGYSSAGNTPERDMTFRFAEPTGGRNGFKEYLGQAVRYPQQAQEEKISGKVTVRFTVAPDGTLNDFEVIRGIGAGCEEELIRAIKQGPAWKPSMRGDQPLQDKVKVRFRFGPP